MDRKKILSRLFLALFLLFSFSLLAACSSSDEGDADTEEQMDGEMNDEDMEDMDHDDKEEGDHAHDEERIPNDGATINLVSPEDGATFAEGEEIIFEVEVENFELGVEGSHWHIYIDGTSWGMVMGGSLDQAIRGVEAGEHEVNVYLAGGDHIELEEGDSVTITVE